MKPVAWLMTDASGREYAMSDFDLRRQQPWVQELWKNAEPLIRAEPEKRDRSDFESDMI